MFHSLDDHISFMGVVYSFVLVRCLFSDFCYFLYSINFGVFRILFIFGSSMSIGNFCTIEWYALLFLGSRIDIYGRILRWGAVIGFVSFIVLMLIFLARLISSIIVDSVSQCCTEDLKTAAPSISIVKIIFVTSKRIFFELFRVAWAETTPSNPLFMINIGYNFSAYIFHQNI